MLVGREAEIRALTALLDAAAAHRGGAVVVRGEAGIGKSALVEHLAGLAAERGMRVAGTSGVLAEVRVAYAGLHRLTRVLGADLRAGDLESPFRAAVDLLDLLGAQPAPVLVAVEDAQWLDRPSWEALTFAARRIDVDDVAMVLTVRDGEDLDRQLAGVGLPEQRLEPLSAADAGILLDRVAPGLSPALRERVLGQAAGNPLGLVELGGIAARSGAGALLPSWLPLSTRVERTFGALVAELPTPTRAVLLVAALDDGDGLDEILAAAGRAEREPVTAADVEPAVASRLVRVDDAYRLRFRHPLLRSALYQSASVAQRRRVHAALAQVLSGDADRQIWHRAAAADGPDEALAAELTATAERAGLSQAVSIALAAFDRAAQLSQDPRERGRRLLNASASAVEQGDLAAARRFLDAVVDEELHPVDRAWLSFTRETFAETAYSGNTRLPVYADLIEALSRDGEVQRASDFLMLMILRFYWSNPDRGIVDRYLEVADGIDLPADDPRVVAATALIDPVGRGTAALERMARLQARFDLSPAQQHMLGLGAAGLGAHDLAVRFYASAVAGLRVQGRIGLLAQVLTAQASAAAYQGDATAATALATEASALATETNQPAWMLTSRLFLGHAQALRGDADGAREAADLGESVLLPAGRLTMLALVQMIRGVEALAGGRPDDAFRQLHRIFDPADVAYHPYQRFVMFAHLAEAGIRCGQEARLRELVDELTPVAAECGSPSLAVGLRFADAVLTGEFGAALAADLSGWPFERARLQLAHGAGLRRQRRATDARPLLRAAAATFDALGATPWADRARAELRASGETLRRPVAAASALTPQELQIARLAAEGLSNRDIAERLFLSPRTVTTHLSRIFPKLGIRSRGELAREIT
ncbi:ATP-binding protein [Virgisporangium ochraceum]|uniref:LuxR family transcriptional regulator n=1 Tax=Virgisporangium ochraceum TaxID=65505 RepID=A0A8J3ZWH4_9ACTN|nr:LuxR family transcriptional regulator [Virgisporangium ochraceum]GIJ70458.1 LuxR family transcriptional regulator [Virgisporangium ochraceum]